MLFKSGMFHRCAQFVGNLTSCTLTTCVSTYLNSCNWTRESMTDWAQHRWQIMGTCNLNYKSPRPLSDHVKIWRDFWGTQKLRQVFSSSGYCDDQVCPFEIMCSFQILPFVYKLDIFLTWYWDTCNLSLWFLIFSCCLSHLIPKPWGHPVDSTDIVHPQSNHFSQLSRLQAAWFTLSACLPWFVSLMVFSLWVPHPCQPVPRQSILNIETSVILWKQRLCHCSGQNSNNSPFHSE